MDSRLSELRTAVINFAAEQSGFAFDPRMLTAADTGDIGETMVNGDSLDMPAVILVATLRAGRW
ncbi:MAG: hypothetical protein U0R81_16585 [Mycobacterium sp.]|nr:hypothetical protein [Mycobacterium sp.]